MRYAALQGSLGQICVCGDGYNHRGTSEGDCTSKCDGDIYNTRCGGANKIWVYEILPNTTHSIWDNGLGEIFMILVRVCQCNLSV